MIVTVITENHIQNVLPRIQAIKYPIDIIELRLDFLQEFTPNLLKAVIEQCPYPMIFTLRSEAEGGKFSGTESQRLELLSELAGLHPDYIDVEASVDSSFIEMIKQKHSDIKIICSYHNFKNTPNNLDGVLEAMQHPAVDIYKIITTAITSLDSLSVLHFLKRHRQQHKLVSHSMGRLGFFSRIVGKVLGNTLNYAQLADANSAAPDCPDLKTLCEIYHFHQLNQATKVYALLGDPVDHSIGHLFHNEKFTTQGSNAVYVKIKLSQDELEVFFKRLPGLPFYGFSVTTPLKEAVLRYINHPDAYTQNIQATNTLRIKNTKIECTNTDGKGALDAVETQQRIEQAHVLILGAGGAAKAIAHEAFSRRPVSLTILNRTLTRAEHLAQKLKAQAYDFVTFTNAQHPGYNIIINTIPTNEENDKHIFKLIKPFLSAKTVYMTIDYSKKSDFLLKKLNQHGCNMVQPTDMFTNQALHQLAYWE